MNKTFSRVEKFAWFAGFCLLRNISENEEKEKSRESPEAERRIFCDGPWATDWPRAGHSESACRGWANLLLHQETPNFVAIVLLDRFLTFLETREPLERREKKKNGGTRPRANWDNCWIMTRVIRRGFIYYLYLFIILTLFDEKLIILFKAKLKTRSEASCQIILNFDFWRLRIIL